ncbi:hypothetical protein IEI94_15145 [Halomonas sp. ML-15]|uniref:hypothetical protein n=1 Tax=Halomonas sp. ML-15 TaxID=2773305 RepID=UPI00174673E9|nr:hypothetical protein [Halomonas sp. ML-15]MBD3897192.1 hypothetical protein [Halomonas sp. ML-15]
MPTEWGKWFVERISELEERLGYILELNQVRELWLQGELYLMSTDDQQLNLNVRDIIAGGSVDFVGESPKMIAELKVCGRGYYSKMLNGFSLTEDVASKKSFSFEDMACHSEAEGSIFKDFCRLFSANSAYEKYMIIVIPKIQGPDRLSEVLEAAKFPGVEVSRRLQWFDVRVFCLPK